MSFTLAFSGFGLPARACGSVVGIRGRLGCGCLCNVGVRADAASSQVDAAARRLAPPRGALPRQARDLPVYSVRETAMTTLLRTRCGEQHGCEQCCSPPRPSRSGRRCGGSSLHKPVRLRPNRHKRPSSPGRPRQRRRPSSSAWMLPINDWRLSKRRSRPRGSARAAQRCGARKPPEPLGKPGRAPGGAIAAAAGRRGFEQLRPHDREPRPHARAAGREAEAVDHAHSPVRGS